MSSEHAWRPEHFDQLLEDVAREDVVILATRDEIGWRDAEEFPESLGRWADEVALQPPQDLPSVRDAIVAKLRGAAGVPFVLLAPRAVYVAMYRGGRLGRWLVLHEEEVAP